MTHLRFTRCFPSHITFNTIDFSHKRKNIKIKAGTLITKHFRIHTKFQFRQEQKLEQIHFQSFMCFFFSRQHTPLCSVLFFFVPRQRALDAVVFSTSSWTHSLSTILWFTAAVPFCPCTVPAPRALRRPACRRFKAPERGGGEVSSTSNLLFFFAFPQYFKSLREMITYDSETPAPISTTSGYYHPLHSAQEQEWPPKPILPTCTLFFCFQKALFVAIARCALRPWGTVRPLFASNRLPLFFPYLPPVILVIIKNLQ